MVEEVTMIAIRKNKIVERMLDCCETVQSHTAGFDYQLFASTSVIRDACCFNLWLLGELAAKFDKNFIKENKQVPWKKIKDLGSKCLHDYENLDFKVVWNFVEKDVPELIHALKTAALRSMRGSLPGISTDFVREEEDRL